MGPTVVEERKEKVSKNYLVHEVDQQEGVDKPSWDDTMTAVFGDHVKWDEVKVYASKHRPLCESLFAYCIST